MAKHDFDEFWREKNGEAEPKSIKIEGKEWKLKSELPAEASLMALKMQEEKDNDDIVHVDDIIDIYNSIMGKEETQELLDSGIGTQKLFGLLKYLMQEVYDLKVDEEKNKTAQQADK